MPSGAVALAAGGVLLGVLIGSIGIGKVLLVPFLVHWWRSRRWWRRA